MAKKNMISINKLESAVKDQIGKVETIDWHGLEIEIKHSISFESVVGLIDSIAGLCFDNGDYRPERVQYAIRSFIVQLYTNLNMPSNANKHYAILFDTDLYDTIIEHINYDQYMSIVNAVSDKVRYIRQVNIDGAQKKINDAANALDELASAVGGVMNGVTGEDMEKLTNAISDGRFDESKLMQAFLDQKYQKDEE